MRVVQSMVVLGGLLAARAAWAGFDPFADALAPVRFAITADDGLRLVLKGAAQLSWLDLEGAGGVGRESATDTVTIGTRSGHVRLDRARLALRLHGPDGLALLTELEFTGERARARAAWIDGRWTLTRNTILHAELGLARPFVATDPVTRRQPLAARVWWGSSEAHLTGEVTQRIGALRLAIGASVALARPLGAAPINDASPRGSVGLLAFEATRPLSGAGPVFGGRIAAALGSIRLEGFGFAGRLGAEGGIDALRNRLEGFRDLPGYVAADPRRQDPRLWWGGARATYRRGAFDLRAEAVWGRESLIRRAVYLAQAVGELPLADGIWLPAGALIVRIEAYRLAHADRLRRVAPSQALSWDWDVLTAAVRLQLYRDLLWLRAEHSLLREARGGPRFPNDETTAQLELRF